MLYSLLENCLKEYNLLQRNNIKIFKRENENNKLLGT